MQRDSAFDGVFITGVKTTGIFCRPVCTARKPLEKNIEFFDDVSEAIRAGYRPCKRCSPLQATDEIPPDIQKLLTLVERDPQKRWKDWQLREIGLQPAAVRRWFQKHYNMTFHGYSRLRRLGEAMQQMKLGENVTRSMDVSGYESESGFRTAFKKYFGNPPGQSRDCTRMWVNRIMTPLGPMLICANDDGLHLLEFVDRRMLETQIKRVRKYTSCYYVPGEHPVMQTTEQQLQEYFNGTRKSFDLPIALMGTEFQQQVWKALLKIPYGETRTYAQQAIAIKNPKAVRAVGTANGDNRFAIIVPCHRVIGADGKLTGYGGGLWRKQKLLELEGAL
ncbi:MAG: bifunctional transcriptional activator/DNA repair protein Ada [Gammaproteobacteria bacterium]|nr:methylated-DNA--[protein]-cysteine S-methyltransferase [Gammaproteobacteria bacterium]NNC97680.1 bifunctional transcriptional activator/DNA repair protein Ada [Gammaproteobacteria bacterium]NNM12856.1 bifunctional transcriptional activator/DNA repair protein Ada [Gammaproteobacteria bacterium]